MNRRERKALAKERAKQIFTEPINLVRVSSGELQALRCKAYNLLIP